MPQVDGLCAGQVGSGSPAGTNRQRPTEPVWLHERQAPLQATLQQVPSEQYPDAQSLSMVHSKPFSFIPQLRTAQDCPAEHWALVAQLASQRLLPGSQE